MPTIKVNLRAGGGNPPESKPLIGTADVEVPVDRFPNDLSWVAPFIMSDSRYFAYRSQSFFGPEPTPEYVEVSPVVVCSRIPDPSLGQ